MPWHWVPLCRGSRGPHGGSGADPTVEGELVAGEVGCGGTEVLGPGTKHWQFNEMKCFKVAGSDF